MNERIQPEVGMGATVSLWGDKLPCTITSVSRNKFRIILKKNKVVRYQGGCFFEEDPDGKEFVVTRRQDGTYRVANTNDMVEIGVRKEHKEE